MCVYILLRVLSIGLVNYLINYNSITKILNLNIIIYHPSYFYILITIAQLTIP